MKPRLIVIAFAAIVPTIGLAQFDFGGGDSTPRAAWEGFNLPNKTLKLDFRNASVDMVLSLFTKTSGITIIKDPSLTQPITLTTAKAVPLKDAFEVLNAALSLRNYDLRKEGNLLVIRQRQQRRDQGGRGGNSSMSFTPDMMSMMSQPNTELRTYQIQFASASQVARMINDVFAQQSSPFGGGRGGMMFGGRGGMMGGFNPFSVLGQQTQVKASSDDFSNTVIVNAPSKVHNQVEDIIKQIDKQAELPSKVKVYALKYASSDDLQPVVQNVLQANVPRGRGGTGTTPIDRQFAFGGMFGGLFGRNNNASAGSVVSETRTNSLIVTTTDDNHKIVEDVVKNLDTEVKLESTTFVFPLENARASDISTLLRQAFGNRAGSTGTSTLNRTNTGTTRTNTRTNTGTNRNRSSGGIQGNSLDEMIVALADPNADSGELATDIQVDSPVMAQMFGTFGQQPQQRRTNNSLQTGRDATGRLVPVQDLTNQVTVIPDQNTNSVIVVTSPENAELIQQILAQLDKIPEQVMIETIIVEASLDASEKLGVEWQYIQNKAFGTTGKTGTANQDFGLRANNTLPQGFRYTLSGGALTGFLNLFQSDSKFNVLSTPRIFTSNNVEAQINISQRVPFVVSQRTDANGNLTYNYEFEDVGIVLTVTPRITSGGYVTMDVSQTANDLQGFTSFNAPIVNQRQADTTVAVKDGETVILGGIMRSTVTSTVSKIPLLGDLPILGNLFKSTNKTNQKTELLVFLTPRVVRNSDEALEMTKEQVGRMSKPSQAQIRKELDAKSKPKEQEKAPEKKSDDPNQGDKKTGDNPR